MPWTRGLAFESVTARELPPHAGLPKGLEGSLPPVFVGSCEYDTCRWNWYVVGKRSASVPSIYRCAPGCGRQNTRYQVELAYISYIRGTYLRLVFGFRLVLSFFGPI